MKAIITTFLVFFLFGEAFSQASLDNLDFNKIPQKKIKSFIRKQKEHNIHDFKDINASCFSEKDLPGFFQHSISYTVNNSIDYVWESYKNANPAMSWKGRILSFGVLFSKNTNYVMYNQDDFGYPGLEIGQVLFINLKLLGGIYNLATAFEVINVDDASKTIEFSYIKGGKVRGKQKITMQQTANGYTHITHSTIYKSRSKFRDKRLYSHFHQKAIDEMHERIQLNMTAQK